MTEQSGTNGTLFLRVLGPTTLERGGTPVTIGGPRQRAVLARLAHAEGRLVVVERLVEDLWGENAPASILTTLQGYVSRLRSALDQPERLRREGPGYVLDLDAHEVDTRTFEDEVARARQVVGADPSAALAHLDRALGLWRGPAFADLADFDEMAWAAAAATRLDELRLSAHELRFDVMLDLGRHAQCVPELETAVNDHPLRERLTSQLAIALYRSGRQADALRALDRTRRVLLDELGLDLSPDLVRLESAILAHDPELSAPIAERAPAPRTVRADAAPVAPTPEAQRTPDGPAPVALPAVVERQAARPFVGREDELAQMREMWADTLAGRRRVVLIEGESGIGKTRLAAQFAVEAHARGAIVMWGRATAEAIVPYEAMVEALRTVLRTVSDEARQRVLDGRKGLGILVPFVGDDVEGDEAPAPELGTDRYVLFETVAELLEAESAMHPIVFVIDDVQYVDGLTFRLLSHLLRHERAARLMVVGTVRTMPPVDNPHCDDFMADLRRDDTLHTVQLSGLGEDDVAALLDVTHSEIPPSKAAVVHRATRGNAFYVSELAEHGDAGSMPASVRDVLNVRLGRLSVAANRLVTFAAVAGTSATLPILGPSTGLDTDELLDAVDESLAAGLLSEDPTTGVLSFRHALVQQVVVDRISQTRRSTMHLAVADALEDVGANALELAHHLLSAGRLVAPDRAVLAAVDAGRRALDVLAYEDGLQWGQRALAVTGTVDATSRCHALLLVSDSQRALGDRHGARSAAVQAADEARRTGDPVVLARAAEALALARAGIGFDFGTEDEGLDDLLREALRGLPSSDVAHRSALLSASLSSAAAAGDLLTLRGLSVEALELAEAHGQQQLVATAHLAARMSNWRVHLLDARLAADRQAFAAAEAAGSKHLQLNALLYGISDLTESGNIPEAYRWFLRLKSLAAEVRQPVYDAFVGFFDATVALLRGDYDRSAQLADDALLRGLQSHGVNAEQAWSGQAFIRAWDRGELGAMTSLVEQAASRPPHLAIWRVALAACLVASGRGDEARPVLDDLVSADRIDHNPDSLYLAIGALLVEVAREVGTAEQAGWLLHHLLPFRGRMIVTGLGRASLGPIDRVLGLAAYLSGDLDLADELLSSAIAQSRAMHARPHVARALFDRSLVLSALGRDDEAAASRGEA
ncbi:MAG: BTAD domain-containing putative transcriptional regulator, partial [Ilumatobacteraceae bacterium]